MTANALLQYLTWLIFGIIFVRVVRDVIQQPTRTTIDITLFFGAPTLVILITALLRLGLLAPTRGLTALTGVLFLSLSYFVVRLVADFTPTPPQVGWLAAVLVILTSGVLIVVPPPQPGWVTLMIIGVFVGFQFYAATAFSRTMRRSTGVTRRRMQAVTLGSVFLGGVLLAVGVRRVVPETALLVQVLALLAALCYSVGFAPPDILRRAWQEPDLRAFLGRAATLPRLPTTEAILTEIARGRRARSVFTRPRLGCGTRQPRCSDFPWTRRSPPIPSRPTFQPSRPSAPSRPSLPRPSWIGIVRPR